jgi:UDP-galactopyranose mutase
MVTQKTKGSVMTNLENGTDLIVFSSHKFDSNEVRTPTLMGQFANRKRVYFIESPIMGVSSTPTYFLKKNDHEVTIIQPYLPSEISVFEQHEASLNLVKELIADEQLSHYTLWTDTPKAMPFIRHLNPEIIVYDCLRDYSKSNPELEHELFQYADVVLTSGLAEKRFSPAQTMKFKIKEAGMADHIAI